MCSTQGTALPSGVGLVKIGRRDRPLFLGIVLAGISACRLHLVLAIARVASPE